MFQNFILKARTMPSEEMSSGTAIFTTPLVARLLRNAPLAMAA